MLCATPMKPIAPTLPKDGSGPERARPVLGANVVELRSDRRATADRVLMPRCAEATAR
jgi:hypothetical protein